MGYFFTELTGPLPSTTSPVTLKMRPKMQSPTGTEMGAPVSSTLMPRERPSEEDMAMVRTTPSPRCCWISRVNFSWRPETVNSMVSA